MVEQVSGAFISAQPPFVLTPVEDSPVLGLGSDPAVRNVNTGDGFYSLTIAYDPYLFDLAGDGEPLSQTINRIWVLPNELNVNNPQIGVPIPFVLWNTFPRVNVLGSITNVPTGLSVAPAAPVSFNPFEEIAFSVTIGANAPPSVDSTFNFNFEAGVGTLRFRAIIVEFIDQVPDAPVTETWSWLTDVIRAWDSSEDRIALRDAPRLTLDFNVTFSEAERQRIESQQILNVIRSRALIPYYQYAASIQQNSAIGQTRVFFNPSLSFVRVDEFVLLVDQVQNQTSLAKVTSIETDGCVLDTPITFEARTASTVIVPMVQSAVNEGANVGIDTVSGVSRIRTEDLNPIFAFTRTQASPTITTFNSLPVLDRRPLNNAEATIDGGKEILRGDDTSARQVETSWPRAQTTRSRRFSVNRYINDGEFEYWREFLNRAKGQANPFYHPTYLTDLTPAALPNQGEATITVRETDYATRFFPFQTYKQLWIQTQDGLEYSIGVTTAAASGELGLSRPFLPTEIDIKTISFLERVRLATDRVRLTHDVFETQLELAFRTADD